VVKWATEALDEERRRAWNSARGAVDRRRAGRAGGLARQLKHARYALWKNPEDLTDHQPWQFMAILLERVSERRKVLLTWENEGVEANILS